MLLVFLDLRKAYNTVDRGHLLTIPEGYGSGTCMYRLLAVFWDQKEVFTRPKRVSRPAVQGNPGDHPGWNNLDHPVKFYC